MSDEQATARQYPEQRGLRQIETKRRERHDTEGTEATATRERTGWQPQSGPSGVFDSWWESPDRQD